MYKESPLIKESPHCEHRNIKKMGGFLVYDMCLNCGYRLNFRMEKCKKYTLEF